MKSSRLELKRSLWRLLVASVLIGFLGVPSTSVSSSEEPPRLSRRSEVNATSSKLTERFQNSDLTERFPEAAWDLGGEGLRYWSQEKRDCFFSAIDSSSYVTVAGVSGLNFLSRSIELVVDQDLPTAFPAVTLAEDSRGHCGGRFIEVQIDGEPASIWISVLEPARGTALVLFWDSDPRAS